MRSAKDFSEAWSNTPLSARGIRWAELLERHHFEKLELWKASISPVQRPIELHTQSSTFNSYLSVLAEPVPPPAMVLDNSSASQSADFADSAPDSDNDTYSSSTSQAYHIDGSQLAKPIPIFGRLFGYNEQYFSKLMQIKIAMYSQELNRPLTNDEANAIAYWTSKQTSIISYANPLAAVAATWRWNSTKATFRFPFYQPNMETFDASVFPSKSMPWLKGHFALRMWTAGRLGAYYIVAMPIAQILLGSYCVSVAAVGQMSDTRLKTMNDQIKTQAQQKRGGLPRQNPQRRAPASASTNTQADDASPTGGMLWEEPASDEGAVNATGTPQTQSSRAQWNPRKPTPNQMTPATSSPGPFDDASPTGGQGVAADTPPASQGSAWERLRRGEKLETSSSTSSNQSAWQRAQNETQKEQRQGSTTGDSFAFSKSDEERSYAKEEAQKEFDLRVERERRGGDFSQNGGDQKRW